MRHPPMPHPSRHRFPHWFPRRFPRSWRESGSRKWICHHRGVDRNPVMGSASGPRVGYIGGVKGNLSYTQDGTTPPDDPIGTMTFTRIDTGTASR
jgi:hypothetical protein